MFKKTKGYGKGGKKGGMRKMMSKGDVAGGMRKKMSKGDVAGGMRKMMSKGNVAGGMKKFAKGGKAYPESVSTQIQWESTAIPKSSKIFFGTYTLSYWSIRLILPI
jgi:hypothetical protein